ncbi:hypothetical protein ASPWEDRAFT_169274 [Aspergillus wentii DTO 134E9]|uniref:BZIP domain-containing protein n=1 Tax=Aspergillus wentii DTO 134E9 TaxID=1073089 RepID=A0A1L9RWX4_ASPWE|nr:uncharacterized protein ASPWEDRAFT_169274 [Aspergillus wentii DTO 134E9]KAI9928891.1 hypothetical protein MW887_001284 [Aspergillus wentii]OJJ39426.1 hypothetical protein ASPWEDRAFT_169274 [Aspergillus wentii DTO 134E9]
MDADKQKKLDRLARVRENQRKSRARRQEHTRELEQTLASCKEQVHQKDIEHRLIVQKLESENRKLRYLLSCSGLSSSTVEEYIRTVDDPAMTQKVAIPALRRSEETAKPQCQEKKCSLPCSSQKVAQSNVALSEEPEESAAGGAYQQLPEPVQKPLLQMSQNFQQLSKEQPLCCMPDDESLDSWASDGDVLDTTLCAIAEELVGQYNTRGIDITEIQKKLKAGFSKGSATGEGCRVQNHILFQVLDEISND